MKLHWKLSAGLGAVVLLTTLAVGVAVSAWTESVVLAQTRRALLDEAVLLREVATQALEAQRPPDPAAVAALQGRVEGLGRTLSTRFTVIAASGDVLADSDERPEVMEDHGDRPEVLEAAATGRGSATRYSQTLQVRMLYVAVALRPEPAEAPVAFVRASLALTEVDRRLYEIREVVLLGSGLGLLVAMIPGVLVARRLTTPIERMTETARALAKGDYRPRLVVRTRDELGSLAEAFNAMAEQLRARMETISTDRNKLRAIFSSMVEGVVAVDEEQRIVHMNGVAARLLQVDPAAAIGERIGDVSQVVEVASALQRVLEEPEPTAQEVRLPGTPQGPTTIELHAAPLRGPDEALAGALVVLHDVTELRRLEAVRRDFVANVSHELKTPLTAIRGQVETLLDDPDMPPPYRERFLIKARNQAERLSALVRDLLVLSRVESAHSGLQLEPHDMCAPVQESARSLQAAAEGKEIALEVSLPPGPLRVRADREYVRQIVDNLLSNAIAYTPERGRVHLELRVEGEDALLEVSDSGIGIAPGDTERIFERFYRVDKARSRDLGGTGLGLAIVKHIVMAHEGTIEVDSALGVGTSFRVRIPRRLRPDEPTESASDLDLA